MVLVCHIDARNPFAIEDAVVVEPTPMISIRQLVARQDCFRKGDHCQRRNNRFPKFWVEEVEVEK